MTKTMEEISPYSTAESGYKCVPCSVIPFNTVSIRLHSFTAISAVNSGSTRRGSSFFLCQSSSAVNSTNTSASPFTSRLVHPDMERASAVGGTMVSLAAKLSMVLGPKYELMAGVRTDIIFLRSELESMHAFLEKLSTVHGPGVQVRCWMKEVRELAYDIEDSLDEFMHRVEANGTTASPTHGSSSLMGFAGRVKQLMSMGWMHLSLANEIKALKARAIEVSERRSRYKGGEDIWMSETHMVADPRISVLYADAPDLVGIERPCFI